ncbi:MAG: hypothetical protein HC843_07925 [Sphingomonadales bacterium]|nr:hypothetical protein [Sphingomonadales bacterium]
MTAGNPSLAICVTGEIRANQTLLDALEEAVLDQTEIFISVWGTVGSKVEGWVAPRQVSRSLGFDIGDALPTSLIGFGEIEKLIPEFFDHIRMTLTSQNVDADRLKNITPYVDIEDRRLFVETLPQWAHQYTMRFIHYKMARAFNLMKCAEQESKNKFDIVARIRPDLCELPCIPTQFDRSEIYLDWLLEEGDGTLMAGDNVIVAHRDVMEDLIEHMRHNMFEKERHHVHEIIGEFILGRKLNAHAIKAEIGVDPWPRDAFLSAIGKRYDANTSCGPTANFVAAIQANICLDNDDLAGAKEALTKASNADEPPILLSRGRLALAEGRKSDAEEIMAQLDAYGAKINMDDYCYYGRQMRAALDNTNI